MHCQTDDGKAVRTLNIIDEYSRECLAIHVDRKLNSGNVIDILSDLFILRGIAQHDRKQTLQEAIVNCVSSDFTDRLGLDATQHGNAQVVDNHCTSSDTVQGKLPAVKAAEPERAVGLCTLVAVVSIHLPEKAAQFALQQQNLPRQNKLLLQRKKNVSR